MSQIGNSCGNVLGIDVGYSKKRKSTGLCLFSWTATSIRWKLLRVGTPDDEREAALKALVPRGTHIRALAIDGPLAANLGIVSGYRACEYLLSQARFSQRGSAAPSSPSSKLHLHATSLGKLALDLQTTGWLTISDAVHAERIHDKAIVEAHPVPYLSTLIDDGVHPAISRGNASDRYYQFLTANGGLSAVVSACLPGRLSAVGFDTVTNHDERAALVCALTALSLASGLYSTVGDPMDGRIVLADPDAWGNNSATSPRSWAEADLRRNKSGLAKNRKVDNAGLAQVTRCGRLWF